MPTCWLAGVPRLFPARRSWPSHAGASSGACLQVIDDSKGHTLASMSTQSPGIRAVTEGKNGNIEAAQLVGKRLAELCLERNIDRVCLDRGGFAFHGRVKALADAAREHGLQF